MQSSLLILFGNLFVLHFLCFSFPLGTPVCSPVVTAIGHEQLFPFAYLSQGVYADLIGFKGSPCNGLDWELRYFSSSDNEYEWLPLLRFDAVLIG